jgi:hypothetical protein
MYLSSREVLHTYYNTVKFPTFTFADQSNESTIFQHLMKKRVDLNFYITLPVRWKYLFFFKTEFNHFVIINFWGNSKNIFLL